MPPKKRAAVGDAKKEGAKPVAVTTVAAVKGTIRIRVEKFSKMKEQVLSEVREIGGFPWQLKVTPPSGTGRGPSLWLSCLYSREARIWHCQAGRKWRVMDTKGTMQEVKDLYQRKELFAAHKPSQQSYSVMETIKKESKKYVKNDAIEIEIEIEVEKEAGDRFRKRLSIDFLTPSEMFDGELSVGEKKVHVNKQFLSMHSPVFKAHFYGDTKEEIELEEGDEKALIEFLKMLYRTENTVTADNAENVLRMAIRFKVQSLIDHVEKFLFSTTDVKVSDKLRMAEKYNLPTLLKGGLLEVKKDGTIRQEVVDSAAFKGYSAKTKKDVNATKRKLPSKAFVGSDGMVDEDDLEDYVLNYMDEMGFEF